MDAGFSNFIDKTNYTSVGSYLVDRPGFSTINENDFKLNGGKSINLNIWLFMQRYNLINHKLNLKYGFGVELNNYVFKSPLSYKENGLVHYSGGVQTNAAFIFRDSISFSKNKLAADYFAVPLMLNFTTDPFSSKKSN